jgi:hypothetical protein
VAIMRPNIQTTRTRGWFFLSVPFRAFREFRGFFLFIFFRFVLLVLWLKK